MDLAVKDDARPKRLALVQEVQHHPLSGKVLHVDFHEVAENEKVTIMVPVETVGEAEGVKTGGGVLEHVLFKIKVRGLPKDLPEQITVDVSHLEDRQGHSPRRNQGARRRRDSRRQEDSGHRRRRAAHRRRGSGRGRRSGRGCRAKSR